MAKKLIKKETKEQNLSSECVCHIPINKKAELQIRATFAFHVFIEKCFNEAYELDFDDKKPLLHFIEKAGNENFLFPVEILEKILKRITVEWFGSKEKVEIDNHDQLSANMLYLLGLCHGGGTFGKKLLALRAMWQMQILGMEKKENPDLMSTSGTMLH